MDREDLTDEEYYIQYIQKGFEAYTLRQNQHNPISDAEYNDTEENPTLENRFAISAPKDKRLCPKGSKKDKKGKCRKLYIMKSKIAHL